MEEIRAVKHREQYVDFVKGCAMISVVLIHIDFVFPTYSFLNTRDILGGLWRVPVFFLVSGFFLRDDKMKHPMIFLKPKFKTLYLKALILYISYVLLHNVFLDWGWYFYDVEYRHGFMHKWDMFEILKHIMVQFLFFYREPVGGAMWYVDSLLIALVGYSLLMWIVNKIRTNEYNKEVIVGMTIFILALISFLLTKKFNVMIPRVSNSLSGLLLIYIGHKMARGGGKI